ncbi:MAG: recombinase family protein [Eubacteriales bacterium]|nr:recombinase family protein [Eubacteriales bacterium]
MSEKVVKVIPAKPVSFAASLPGVIRKRRVGAYARVSTDSEEQANSYAAQVDYYRQYIKSNPEWEYIDVYADDYAIIGISGRNLDISRDLELGSIIFLPSFLLFHLKVKIYIER